RVARGADGLGSALAGRADAELVRRAVVAVVARRALLDGGVDALTLAVADVVRAVVRVVLTRAAVRLELADGRAAVAVGVVAVVALLARIEHVVAAGVLVVVPVGIELLHGERGGVDERVEPAQRAGA